MSSCVLQLSEALPRRVSFTASSVLQSATRPGASGSGTALLLVHGDASAAGALVAVCGAAQADTTKASTIRASIQPSLWILRFDDIRVLL